jgi:hypothetical protein
LLSLAANLGRSLAPNFSEKVLTLQNSVSPERLLGENSSK